MAMSNSGLAKLAEECGELLQVVGKKLAYPEGDHPDGVGPLDERMQEEMADVMAAILFTANKLKLDVEAIGNRMETKIALFEKWDESGISTL